jgi:undecaprenol kinase
MSSKRLPDNVLKLPTRQADGVNSSLQPGMLAPDTIRNPFKARHFLASVGFALEGLRYLAVTERNFKIDVALATVAITLGCVHAISATEWLALLLVCGLVLFAEATNTAIELVVDMLTKGEFDARAKVVKDVAAGACLVCATVAASVGSLIFVPRWLALLNG